VALPAKYISRALETTLERDAVGASATANLLLETLHSLAPALQLHTECQRNPEADEVCLLQFAFEQGESWKPASS
jgi:hypothetical protein